MDWTDKYKPRNLDEVAGHEKLKSVIQTYIEVGDIPHFFFYGTQGTGKTLFAELIGMLLLRECFDDNFIPVDASNDRSLGKIRKLVMNVIRNLPIMGSLRIIRFDECDGLFEDTQQFLRGAINNCNTTRFIFTCNDKTEIIEPLQDRCMCFEFKPLKKEDIIKRLKFVAMSEQLTISDTEIEQIAKESNGSMRKAIIELEKASMVGNDEEEILRRYLEK